MESALLIKMGFVILGIIIPGTLAIIDYKKNHAVMSVKFIVLVVSSILFLLFGVITTLNEFYGPKDDKDEIIAAIQERIPDYKSALIDLTNIPTGNPVIMAGKQKYFYDVYIGLTNKGNGVAFNIMEICRFVYVKGDSIYTNTAMPNAPVGAGYNFTVTPGYDFHIRSTIILRPPEVSFKELGIRDTLRTENSHTTAEVDKVYFAFRMTYSDSANANKDFSRIFEVPNPTIEGKQLQFTDSKSYKRIEKYLFDSGIWKVHQ